MTRQVALLRGVNVGGSHKLAMADLRAGLSEAGCTDVVTYVQSGNVVLSPPSPAPDDLRTWLERTITAIAGFPAPVVLRSADELRSTVERNPYPGEGGTQLHVLFLSDAPDAQLLAGIDAAAHAPESFTLVGRDLYLHLPDGMGRAKLPSAIEKVARRAASPPAATARNWNTVLKLADLAAG